MASKQVIRELVTLWGFDIDQQPLKEVDAGINTIKASLKSLAIATAAGAAAIGFLLNEAGQDEQTVIAFETMLGSAEAAAQKLKELDDFAKRTPFTLKGIRSSSKQLLAMNIEAESLLPTLKFLGDVSAGLSVPLSRLALNFGQVRNQNQLTGRELRDFAIAGVPLLDELAKNLGKTTDEISKMISAGDISFKNVEDAFISMTTGSGRFADLMTKQSKSFFGILSNITDVIDLLSRDLGKKLLPEAKRIAFSFLEILEINRELILTNLGEFVENLAEFMGDLFDVTRALFRAMTGVVKIFGGWNKVLGITFKLISTILGLGLVLGIGLITKGLGALLIAWGLNALAMGANIAEGFALLGVHGGLIASFKLLGNTALVAQAKIALVPLAIGAIIVAMALVAEDIFAFSEGRDSVFGKLIEALDIVFGTTKSKMEAFGTFMIGFIKFITFPIRALVGAFKNVGIAIDVIKGKKSFLGGLSEAASNFGNIFSPEAGGRGLFNLASQAGDIDGAIENGSSSAAANQNRPTIGQAGKSGRIISVSSKNEINLNVTGMDAETAQDFLFLNLGEKLDEVFRAAVRDGESAIEK